LDNLLLQLENNTGDRTDIMDFSLPYFIAYSSIMIYREQIKMPQQ